MVLVAFLDSPSVPFLLASLVNLLLDLCSNKLPEVLLWTSFSYNKHFTKSLVTGPNPKYLHAAPFSLNSSRCRPEHALPAMQTCRKPSPPIPISNCKSRILFMRSLVCPLIPVAEFSFGDPERAIRFHKHSVAAITAVCRFADPHLFRCWLLLVHNFVCKTTSLI
jgi:hypothetical protein